MVSKPWPLEGYCYLSLAFLFSSPSHYTKTVGEGRGEGNAKDWTQGPEHGKHSSTIELHSCPCLKTSQTFC